MDEETLLTAEELASFLRTTTQTIYNSIHKGLEGSHIPRSISIGRRRLWLKSEVLAWVRSIESGDCHSYRDDLSPLPPRIRRV